MSYAKYLAKKERRRKPLQPLKEHKYGILCNFIYAVECTLEVSVCYNDKHFIKPMSLLPNLWQIVSSHSSN